MYPYYDSVTKQRDVALLTLDLPAAAGTATIPLATSADLPLYATGQPATIMGWGATSALGSDVPDLLQIGAAAVQSNAACNAYRPFHPGFDLCAAAPGFVPSACHGDSGGPLVASTPAGPVEIGVLSYGIVGLLGACGRGPDFFTRASSIQSWVASVIGNTPAPAVFAPPFLAPAPPSASLSADGVIATLAAPVADPATLATGFAASLLDTAGTPISTQTLGSTATSVSFPALQPGTYGRTRARSS